MEKFIEEFKKSHPEWDGTDPAEFQKLAAAEITRLRAEAEAARQREQAIAAMLEADPRAGAFLRNWSEGNDPAVELMRQFGPELREALDNPELQQRLAEANSEYLERLERERGLDSEFSSNIAESLAMVDRLGADRSLDDALLERAWEWLRKVTDDGIHGVVSEEAMLMAIKAVSHDADVAEARRAGEISGRNEAIDAHLRQCAAGDGTIASASAGGALGRRRRFPDLGVIDAFETFRSVWE